MFKVGDKVRCIDVNSAQEGLRLGNVYTIAYISPSGRIQVYGDGAYWFPSHFALVPNEMEVKHYEIEVNVDVARDLNHEKWVTLENKGVAMKCKTVSNAKAIKDLYGYCKARIIEVSETRKVVEWNYTP
jgi:hypothetical protein